MMTVLSGVLVLISSIIVLVLVVVLLNDGVCLGRGIAETKET